MTYILDIPSTSTAAGRRVDLWFVRTNRASGTLIRTNGVWELVVGQAVTGASYAAVNSTYSAMEASAGTISGNPAIVLASGYVAATNQTKGAQSRSLSSRYPITLNQAGAIRALGTLSLLATGFGGTSTVQASLSWREIR